MLFNCLLYDMTKLLYVRTPGRYTTHRRIRFMDRGVKENRDCSVKSVKKYRGTY